VIGRTDFGKLMGQSISCIGVSMGAVQSVVPVLLQWNSYAFANMGQMCHYACGLCL